MRRGGIFNLLVFVLVVTFVSTGTVANQHFKIDKEHHHNSSHHHHNQNHPHNHHHHGNALAEENQDNHVSSREEEADLQPSHGHENEEEEEEFYDDYSSRRELFQLTDRDGDGFVTRDEYVLQNGNLSVVVDQVFMAYDGDGDGRFSEEEFLQQSSPLEVHAECEEQIIQTCEKLFLEFRPTTGPTPNTLSQPACKAVQYLVDCVAGFDTDCDITSYAQAVASRAKAYIDTGACPSLYLQHLLQVTRQYGLADSNKARFARSIEDVEITTVSDKELYGKHCPDAFINRCAQKFEKALSQESQSAYCPILASYAHCLKKRVKHCSADVNNPLLRKNMERLNKLQIKAKSCRKTQRDAYNQ